MSFPWEEDTWVGVDYLESIGADSNCVICYQELREMWAKGTTFPCPLFDEPDLCLSLGFG